MPGDLQKRWDVEALRGVAVIAVVAAHAWGVPAPGWLGVDLFFVLSGFVITRGLDRERRRTGRIDLVRFAGRRVRRLLPSALVVIGVTTVGAWLLWFRTYATDVTTDGLAALLGSMNWHLVAQHADYFADETPSPFQHFWSLAVEEQFYAVWPAVFLALVLALRRRRDVLLPIAVAFLLSVSGAYALTSPDLGYFDTFGRAWELLAGAFVALVPAVAASRTAAVLRGVGTALVLAALTAPWSSLASPAVIVLGTGLVLLSGGVSLERRSGRLVVQPLAAVGRVSYALYLWHMPLIVAAALLAPGAVGAAAAVATAALLAWVTTRYVEEPARGIGATNRRRHRSARSGDRSSRRAALRRWPPVAFPIAVLVVSVVTVTVADPAGVLRRVVPGAAIEAAGTPTFADVDELRAAVEQSLHADPAPSDDTARQAAYGQQKALPTSMYGPDRCLVQAGERLRRCGAHGHADVLLIGDSTTLAWSPAVIGALPRGTTWTMAGVASCSPVLPQPSIADRWSTACLQSKRDMLDLIDRVDPAVVVMSAVNGEVAERLSGLDAATAARAWQTSVSSTFDVAATNRRQVVWLTAPAEGPFLPACVNRATGFASCDAGATPFDVSKLAAERRAADIAPSVTLVDSAGWLCDPSRLRCPAVVDGTVVRKDRFHLTEAFSGRLVPVMRSALAPVLRATSA